MGIPFVVFLLIYIVAAAFILLFAAFALYHVVRYALASTVSIVMTTFFVSGLVIILTVSIVAIVRIEWDQVFYFTVF